MRNARQILDIVVATFGQQILEPNSDVEALKDSNADYLELARGWQALADRYSKTVDDGNYSQLIPSITQVSIRPLHRGFRFNRSNGHIVASQGSGPHKRHG
jgi:hypothetical protein